MTSHTQIETTTADLTAETLALVNQSGAKLNEGLEQSMKTAEQVVSFSQGNIEAVTKSSRIWIAGVQDLTRQVAASINTSAQQTVVRFKALGKAKSAKEAIELQSGFARSGLEKLIADSTRLTEAWVKLTGEAFAPLSARGKLAFEASGTVA